MVVYHPVKVIGIGDGSYPIGFRVDGSFLSPRMNWSFLSCSKVLGTWGVPEAPKSHQTLGGGAAAA